MKHVLTVDRGPDHPVYVEVFDQLEEAQSGYNYFCAVVREGTIILREDVTEREVVNYVFGI